MKLEQQVCSLESAKRLKELGVKQESLYNWLEADDGARLMKNPTLDTYKYFDQYSAFTVAELGEMLPKRLKHHWKVGSMYKFKKGTYVDLRISCNERTSEWVVSYYGDTGLNDMKDIYFYGEIAKTEAEARAKMLIYLLENKLIPQDHE